MFSVVSSKQEILSSKGLMIVSSMAKVKTQYQLNGFEVKQTSLVGTVFDAEAFRTIYGNSCQIIKTSKQTGLITDKYLVLHIEDLFRSATIIHLFYTGHGKINGNWAVQIQCNGKNQLIYMSLKRILEKWIKFKRDDKSQLNIYIDCCYSGAWVEQLQEQKIRGVNIYASCQSNKTSLSKQGGLFFRCLFGQEQEIEKNLQTLNEQHQRPQLLQNQQKMAVNKKNILQIRIYLSETLRKTGQCKKIYVRHEQRLKIPQSEITFQTQPSLNNPQQQNKQPGLIFELQCHNPTCIDKPIHINIGKRGPYALQQQKSNCICPYCSHPLPSQNIRKISIRLTQKMIAKTYGLYQQSERRYQKQRDQHSMTKCGKNQCVLFDDIKTLDQRWASFEVLFEELAENL